MTDRRRDERTDREALRVVSKLGKLASGLQDALVHGRPRWAKRDSRRALDDDER